MLAWAAELAQQFHVVHQICNNAGIADAGTIEEFGFDAYRRVLDINLWGVIHGTKAFLPYLIASGDGHVVNVSSLNGIMAQAELSAYCASKFAVRGFTETLALELAQAGRPVRSTVVHPGGCEDEHRLRRAGQRRGAGPPGHRRRALPSPHLQREAADPRRRPGG